MMKRSAAWTASSASFAFAFALVIVTPGCKKAEPKPVHTEPWLAYPPASALSTPDAALPTTRYVLTQQSQVRFELPTKRGKVTGKLTKVSGELTVALGALAQSRGQVHVDLTSLTLDDDSSESAAWLSRAQLALGAADAGASASASFEVTTLDDVAPETMEPATARDGGAPPARRVRATAEGNFLLNGFRVLKREPLEAEFGFANDLSVPATVLIRSRVPLVVSLETHEIHLRDPAGSGAERRRGRPAPSPRDVRISVELYGTKE